MTEDQPSGDRRAQVLDAALATFQRYGFRKTSMDDVARAASISRPGLYFLFGTKQELFGAAVARAVEQDLAAAERTLEDTGRPLDERLLAALLTWSSRYVGSTGSEISALVEANRALLGDALLDYPARFRALVRRAITEATGSTDAGPTNAGPAHAGSAATGSTDAGSTDAGPTNAGPAHADPTDACPANTGPDRTGPADDVGKEQVEAVTTTLLNAAIGAKHRAADAQALAADLRTAIDLLVGAGKR